VSQPPSAKSTPTRPAARPRESAAGRGESEIVAPPEADGTLIPVEPETATSPSWFDRLRERLAGEEWEAVIGGSWLNKVGALVLVVGLALFLGYSLTHLGPAGKIALGLAVGGAMLGSGVVLERRERYVVFARGLIGGGWAAVYFTAYATHGLEATRVIQEPLLAMLLLAGVATGIILHSLRYRSQAVTGLAYAIGFLTIALSPASSFALVGSIPLAGSLLFVARRLGWDSLAVAGVVTTYGTYGLRHGLGASTDAVSGQAALVAYWLLFETFDLAALARTRAVAGPARPILALNACGFVGTSLLHWSGRMPDRIDLLFAAGGVLYLASAVLRARFARPPRDEAEADPAAVLRRALAGGAEGAVTVAVLTVTPAIFLRFTGLDVTLALLVEAELLVLAGRQLRQPYLRGLGALVLLVALRQLGLVAAGGEQVVFGVRPQVVQLEVTGLHLGIARWTPIAILTAALLYGNRALLWTDARSPFVIPERAYTYVASGLVALLLGVEVPHAALGITWLAAALPLWEVGIRTPLREFRFQAYGLAALGIATLVVTKVLGIGVDPRWAAPPSLGLAALLTYGLATRVHRLADRALPVRERALLWEGATAAGTGALLTCLWYALPTPTVALGWAAVGLVLVEVGNALPASALRVQGHLAVGLAVGRLLLANFTGVGETAGVSHRLLTVVPVVVLCYFLAARQRDDDPASAGAGRLGSAYFWVAAGLAVLLVRFEVGRVLAVVGWAILMLGLLVAGLRLNVRDLRWQSYALAAILVVRSWVTNFYAPESLAGWAGRIATGTTVILSLYLAQGASPRRPLETGDAAAWRERPFLYFDHHARTLFGTLATVLLTVLLAYEVSGRLLTVAWGLEGIALAGAGFALRERSLRLSGLALLGACVLKVFLYDLRELETLYRILSFIVLGLVLLGVSLVYTRFRDHLRRYL
jgi:predicted membrane protein DUF2339